MSKRIIVSLAGFAGILCAPQLAAQGGSTLTNARGLTSGYALGMTLSGTSAAADAGTHIKATGRASQFPTEWTPANFPDPGGAQEWHDYSKSARHGTFAQHVKENGSSSGNGFIPDIDSNGVPMVRAWGTWMAVIVSVTDGSIGKPGSHFRSRTNGTLPGTGTRTSAGSDLVGYYYPESTGLTPGLAGATLVEQVAEGMGLPGQMNQDIGGLDLGLGVNTLNVNTGSMVTFPKRAEYYFTLSQSCITDVNNHAAIAGRKFAENSLGAEVDANAATIYLMTSSGGSWSIPEEYRTAADLGLNPAVHDLDAIEVGRNGQVVVFSTVYSTAPNSPTSQLMVQHFDSISSLSVVGPLKSYRGPTGNNTFLVANKTGATNDTSDVDGVCVIDPEAYVYGTHSGTPVGIYGKNKSVKQTMGLSVTRTAVNVPKDALVVQCTGWGDTYPHGAPVRLKLSWDYNPMLPMNSYNWFTIRTQYRSPADYEFDFVFLGVTGISGTTVFLAAETVLGGSSGSDAGTVSTDADPLTSWISAIIL